MLEFLSLGAFVSGGVAAVYRPGSLGLILGCAGVILSAGLRSSAPGAWPLVCALALVLLATLAGSWLEKSAPLPEGSSHSELARTVTGQLAALAAGAMLFGPATGASLFAAVVGRHFPYSVIQTGQYMFKRMLARALRLLAVALAAALAVGHLFAG